MNYQCSLIEQATEQALSVRTRCAVQDLPKVMGEAYGAIMQYLMEIGENPAGAPFAAYYNMDMNDLDVEIGFPVAQKIDGKGKVQSSEIPAGKYATTLHIGPYSGVEPAYNALMAWINENNYTPTGIAYEFYLNDPSEIPENELQTQIMFSLK